MPIPFKKLPPPTGPGALPQVDMEQLVSSIARLVPGNLSNRPRTDGSRTGQAIPVPRTRSEFQRPQPDVRSPPSSVSSLSGLVNALTGRTDLDAFDEMARRDSVGADCLWQAIDNHYRRHYDLRLRRVDDFRLDETLSRMEAEVTTTPAGGRLPFVERVMSVAKRSVGIDDNAVMAPLVLHADVEPFGIIAQESLILPQDEGACMRAATKWVATQIAGVPFKYQGMNADKVNAKQKVYIDEVDAAHNGMRPDDPQRIAVAVDVAVARIGRWTAEFSDTSVVPHRVLRNEVGVLDARNCSPTEFLAERPLEAGQALIALCRKHDSAGQMLSGHAVALMAGSPARLFDSGAGTVFDVLNLDLGAAMEAYVRQLNFPNEVVSSTMVRLGAASAMSPTERAAMEMFQSRRIGPRTG